MHFIVIQIHHKTSETVQVSPKSEIELTRMAPFPPLAGAKYSKYTKTDSV